MSFNAHIRPIFAKHCVACHGGVKQASGLSLIYREQATAECDSGMAPIVPGNSEESYLMERVADADPELRMPPADHGPPLTEQQILVYQVPQPEPLYKLEARRAETLKLHAAEEYGLVNVKLYEDLAHWGHVETTYDYPVRVDGRYVMSPSPIPSFDNPKMHQSPALQLFGAGREKRIYAIPPHTDVVSLDFDDHPFSVPRQGHACALCGCTESFLDEVLMNGGQRLWACSDSDWCREQREMHVG